VHFILEQSASFIIVTSPAPHVLATAVGFGGMQNGGSHDPHDGVENEEADCESGVVDCCLLCPVVTASPVGVEDCEADGQRDAAYTEQSHLWPDLLSLSPNGEVVPWRDHLCLVEDLEGCGQHGKDDKTAREVDASEEESGHPDPCLDFLWVWLVIWYYPMFK
jgi:hypothetical protein